MGGEGDRGWFCKKGVMRRFGTGGVLDSFKHDTTLPVELEIPSYVLSLYSLLFLFGYCGR